MLKSISDFKKQYRMKTLKRIWVYMIFIENECQKCREWTIFGRM